MTRQALGRALLGGAAALVVSSAGAFVAGCVEAIRLMTIGDDPHFLTSIARLDIEALKFLLFVGMAGAIVGTIVSLPSIIVFYLTYLSIGRTAATLSKRVRALLSFGAATIFAVALLPVQFHLKIWIARIDFVAEIVAIFVVAPIAAWIFWKVARLSEGVAVRPPAPPPAR